MPKLQDIQFSKSQFVYPNFSPFVLSDAQLVAEYRASSIEERKLFVKFNGATMAPNGLPSMRKSMKTMCVKHLLSTFNL